VVAKSGVRQHRIGKQRRELEPQPQHQKRGLYLGQFRQRITKSGDQRADKNLNDCGEKHPLQRDQGRSQPAHHGHALNRRQVGVAGLVLGPHP
jgi:hypothetical protein